LWFVLQDENIRLSPARTMSLEDVVTYIGEDEMIDVTPSKIRIRYEGSSIDTIAQFLFSLVLL
jgi:predicted membrane GTPase involved in stress response